MIKLTYIKHQHNLWVLPVSCPVEEQVFSAQI